MHNTDSHCVASNLRQKLTDLTAAPDAVLADTEVVRHILWLHQRLLSLTQSPPSECEPTLELGPASECEPESNDHIPVAASGKKLFRAPQSKIAKPGKRKRRIVLQLSKIQPQAASKTSEQRWPRIQPAKSLDEKLRADREAKAEIDYIEESEYDIESTLQNLQEQIDMGFDEIQHDILLHMTNTNTRYTRYAYRETWWRYLLSCEDGLRTKSEFFQRYPLSLRNVAEYATRCGEAFDFLEQNMTGLGLIVKAKLLNQPGAVIIEFVNLAVRNKAVKMLATRIFAGWQLFRRRLHCYYADAPSQSAYCTTRTPLLCADTSERSGALELEDRVGQDVNAEGWSDSTKSGDQSSIQAGMDANITETNSRQRLDEMFEEGATNINNFMTFAADLNKYMDDPVPQQIRGAGRVTEAQHQGLPDNTAIDLIDHVGFTDLFPFESHHDEFSQGHIDSVRSETTV